MGRRLNQEAAKTIKYGGMTEMQAWKMVTLNPARLLHLDQRMGSIKPGKDADLVLWSANPLSIYARVLYTYVDGRCYFDRERDERMRQEIMQERQRLIRKMMTAKANGEKPGRKTSRPADDLYNCDTDTDYGN
jgi:adenine deaminase